ncbi:threonine/serine dehydratase [Azospirillum cavernae]|uniref:threonine/serine dehydratase n=1 Tax=Azospirillum cavernae TaxID=2320860 RepID=UPI0018F495A9|nr:threonine/serine dehydratase [Azospirillum cavernae]
MILLPDRADVDAAHARIRPWIRRTPVIAVGEEVSGVAAPVLLKLDLMQRTGSFKARGAFSALLAAPVPDAGVVAASGGNHGAAVAYAAMRLGHPAAIFVPETAPQVKVDRLTRCNAAVHRVGRVYADAFAAALEHQAQTGARLLHAYDDPQIIAGQGTAAAEFADQAVNVEGFGGLDTVLVAVGGGGLLGGVIAALAGQGVRIVAVESVGAPTLARALAAGHPVEVDVHGLAADSLGARRIGDHGFALAQAHLHASLLVEDDEIREAQRRLWQELRLVAEPGGAVALAALTSGRYQTGATERVGVILCGGNTDPATLSS